MDWLLLIARVVLVSTFVDAGLRFHLGKRQIATAYARSMGAPLPELAVPLTGIAMAVAGVLVALGIWVDVAALVIAACVLGFAYWMHAFWKIPDAEMRQMQQAHFMKNLSMAGGALVLFYLFNQFGPEIGLTIGDGRLFARL